MRQQLNGAHIAKYRDLFVRMVSVFMFAATMLARMTTTQRIDTQSRCTGDDIITSVTTTYINYDS